MADVATKDLRRHLSDFLHRSAYGKERHVITRHNRELAAIVPMEDYELLKILEDSIDLERAREVLANREHEDTITLEDLRDELGL